MSKMITIAEYVKKIGKESAKSHIYKKARDGKFKTAIKVGRTWLINENELYVDERFKKERKGKKMKKIIDGKMYNTETAKILGERSNGYGYTDFNYLCETLYKTKNDNFFLHGEGGGLTSYAATHGNSQGFGEDIIPLTEEKAREWAEENLSADEYIKAFGEPEEA